MAGTNNWNTSSCNLLTNYDSRILNWFHSVLIDFCYTAALCSIWYVCMYVLCGVDYDVVVMWLFGYVIM